MIFSNPAYSSSTQRKSHRRAVAIVPFPAVVGYEVDLEVIAYFKTDDLEGLYRSGGVTGKEAEAFDASFGHHCAGILRKHGYIGMLEYDEDSISRPVDALLYRYEKEGEKTCLVWDMNWMDATELLQKELLKEKYKQGMYEFIPEYPVTVTTKLVSDSVVRRNLEMAIKGKYQDSEITARMFEIKAYYAAYVSSELIEFKKRYIESEHTEGDINVRTKILDDGLHMKWHNSGSSGRVYGYRSTIGIARNAQEAATGTPIINSTNREGEYLDRMTPGQVMYYMFFVEREIEGEPTGRILDEITGTRGPSHVELQNYTAFSRVLPVDEEPLDEQIERLKKEGALKRIQDAQKDPVTKADEKLAEELEISDLTFMRLAQAAEADEKVKSTIDQSDLPDERKEDLHHDREQHFEMLRARLLGE